MRLSFHLRFIVLTAAIILTALPLTACSGEDSDEFLGNIYEITIDQPGDIYAVFKFLDYPQEVTFKLFPEIAPEAVEQFITRAERGFYDRRNIHRVIPNLLIQGGSVNFDGTDGAVEEKEFFKTETSEYARNFYGALCMAADARNRNYCQFYIVTNNESADIDADIAKIEELLDDSERPLNDSARARLETNLQKLKAIPENVRQLYLTRGGAYQFDGETTVFGQLVGGSEVIEAIATTEVVAGNQLDDENNIKSKPVEEIIIESVKIIRIPLEEEIPEETTRSRRGGLNTTAAPTITDAPVSETIPEPEPQSQPESQPPESEPVSEPETAIPESQEVESVEFDEIESGA